MTVFGGTGFLGRYVINRLGKMGCRVVVPFRGDEIMVRHLKPMGDLGVVNFFDMSIRDPDQIEEAVAGSNIVINLLGKHFETSRWKFQDVHSTFPSVLGTICAEQGVERLVHVSALLHVACPNLGTPLIPATQLRGRSRGEGQNQGRPEEGT